MREEGKKGLKVPTEGESPQGAVPPEFTNMVQYFHKRVSAGFSVTDTSLVPRLSAQLFFARSKISWAESLGTRLP